MQEEMTGSIRHEKDMLAANGCPLFFLWNVIV
jgi:hypothetical protein